VSVAGGPAEPAALRAQIHSFLENAPKPAGLRNYGPTPTAADVEPGRAWHRYLAEHRYVCLHWPVEYGGADASVLFQAIFAEECARAGVPRQLGITGVPFIAIDMALGVSGAQPTETLASALQQAWERRG